MRHLVYVFKPHSRSAAFLYFLIAAMIYGFSVKFPA
jgi:hypothetical protein